MGAIDELIDQRSRGSQASSAWKYLEDILARYRTNTLKELVAQVRAGNETLVLSAKLAALADIEDLVHRDIRLGESAQGQLTKGGSQ